MDAYHRQVHPRDSRAGRDCQFCQRFDPDFSQRDPQDRWVELEDSAHSHISENGHVRHRLFEIARRRAESVALSPVRVKSA
jgi:hypothetical protein